MAFTAKDEAHKFKSKLECPLDDQDLLSNLDESVDEVFDDPLL